MAYTQRAIVTSPSKLRIPRRWLHRLPDPSTAAVVIKANLSKTVYGQDDPITVRVNIQNNSDERLIINTDPTNPEDGIMLQRSDSTRIKLLHPWTAESFCFKGGGGVKPHSHLTFRVHLREWFVIDQTGQYSLQYRTQLPNSSIAIESKTGAFEVK